MPTPSIETASNAIKAVVDFLVPIACVHCGVEGSLWCDQCIENAPKLANNTCLKCGERTAENLQLCGDCVALPPPLDRLVPIYRYGGPARSVVHALKYRHVTGIAPTMAGTMSAHSFASRAHLDCVAPVPAHQDRLRERGYNQASLLAREIADKLQLQFVEDALTKTRTTQSQVELTKQQPRDLAEGRVRSQLQLRRWACSSHRRCLHYWKHPHELCRRVETRRSPTRLGNRVRERDPRNRIR